MIDFIAGVAYALNATIKSATADSYFIAPRDVDVSGEDFDDDDGDDTFSDL
jgi:FtsZ-interacting cell division protein YlmF